MVKRGRRGEIGKIGDKGIKRKIPDSYYTGHYNPTEIPKHQ
jgi:hypothetical protein